jgi:hypothetical protein
LFCFVLFLKKPQSSHFLSLNCLDSAQKEKKQARAAKGGAKGGAKAAAKPSGEKKKEAAPAAAKKDAGKAKK